MIYLLVPEPLTFYSSSTCILTYPKTPNALLVKTFHITPAASGAPSWNSYREWLRHSFDMVAGLAPANSMEPSLKGHQWVSQRKDALWEIELRKHWVKQIALLKLEHQNKYWPKWVTIH